MSEQENVSSPPLEGEMSTVRVARADDALDLVVAAALNGPEGTQPSCPICQQEDWQRITSDFRFGSGQGPTIYHGDLGAGETVDERDIGPLLVLVRACRGCGFVRAHAAKRIDSLAREIRQ